MIEYVWKMNPTHQWIQKISLPLFPLNSFIIVIYTKQKKKLYTYFNQLDLCLPPYLCKTNNIKLMDVKFSVDPV